jgi:hypothetical protein
MALREIDCPNCAGAGKIPVETYRSVASKIEPVAAKAADGMWERIGFVLAVGYGCFLPIQFSLYMKPGLEWAALVTWCLPVIVVLFTVSDRDSRLYKWSFRKKVLAVIYWPISIWIVLFLILRMIFWIIIPGIFKGVFWLARFLFLTAKSWLLYGRVIVKDDEDAVLPEVILPADGHVRVTVQGRNGLEEVDMPREAAEFLHAKSTDRP